MLKRNKKNKLLFIITSVILVLGMSVFALFGNIFVAPTNLFAGSYSENQSTAKIKNPNFKATFSSNTIISSNFSNWSTISPDNTTVNDYKKGVVDVRKIESSVNEDSLWDDYNLVASPGNILSSSISDESDEYYYYLMINSPTKAGRFGYSSDSFTLTSNSYYVISVTAKTINVNDTINNHSSDAFLSIYLDGLSDSDADNSFEYVSTVNSWKTYNFYISTNPFQNETLSLKLWLGGNDLNEIAQGSVFFNNVSITQYSEDLYTNKLNTNTNPQTNLNVDLKIPYLSDVIENASFENGLTDWSILKDVRTNSSTSIITRVNLNPYNTELFDGAVDYNPNTNNSSTAGTSALFMYLKNDGFLGVKSSEFVIPMHKCYRVSIWANSNCNIGSGATIKLSETDNSENAIAPATLTVSTNTSSSGTKFENNWVEYSFYVSGNSLFDKSIQIELLLGTSSAQTKGYVFFDDIRFQEITVSDFSKGSSNTSNTTTFKLESATDYFTIPNGFFNAIDNSTTANTTYPFSPKGWETNITKPYATQSGIINTNKNIFTENNSNYGYLNYTTNFKLPSETHIEESKQSNNVLLMRSTSSTNTINYKSTSFSASTNNYYIISVYVLTNYDSSFSSYEGAKISFYTDNFAIQTLENINTNGQWKKYNIYFANSFNNLTCYLDLSFNNTKGYVMFDEVSLYQSTAGEYDSVNENSDKTIVKTDLNKINFNNDDLFDISESTGVDLDLTQFGTVNTLDYSNSNLANYYAQNPTAANGTNNVMYLYSNIEANLKYTSKISYNLAGSSYYKFSVWAKTDNLHSDLCDEKDCGAFISYMYSDTVHTFDKINNEGIYKEYIFYINPEETIDVKFSFSLGTNENPVSGILFISDFSITKFADETEFTTDQDANKSSDNKIVKSVIAEAKPEEETDDESVDDWNSNSSALLAASSIITALAIIIALVGWVIRKIKWRKNTKIKTSYDRRKTLDKNIEIKDRITMRENLIVSLQEELESVKEEEKSYKQSSKEILANAENDYKESIKPFEVDLATVTKEKDDLQKSMNEKIAKNTEAKKDIDVSGEKRVAELEKEIDKIKKKINKIENPYKHIQQSVNSQLEKLSQEKLLIEKDITDIKSEIENLSKQNKEDFSNYRENKKKKSLTQ